MAGVRALVRKEGVRESDVSRKHAIYDHAADGGPAALLSVAGGKITGYRAIAEDAVDQACRKLGHRARCTTAEQPLPGAPLDRAALAERLRHQTTTLGLSAEQAAYLYSTYGRRAETVLELAAGSTEMRERVCPDQPTITAEVAHAARAEAAVRLTDVLLRRTPLGFAPGQALEAAPRVATVLGCELGWDAEEQAREVSAYRDHVEALYAVTGV
jgi:glycerol-3-phosphate dehydrogenase